MLLCTTISLVYAIAYIQLKCFALLLSLRLFRYSQKSFVFIFLLIFQNILFRLMWDVLCTLWPASSAFPFRFKHPHQSQHISKDGRPHMHRKTREEHSTRCFYSIWVREEETTSIRKHKRTRGTYIIRKKEKKENKTQRITTWSGAGQDEKGGKL